MLPITCPRSSTTSASLRSKSCSIDRHRWTKRPTTKLFLPLCMQYSWTLLKIDKEEKNWRVQWCLVTNDTPSPPFQQNPYWSTKCLALVDVLTVADVRVLCDVWSCSSSSMSLLSSILWTSSCLHLCVSISSFFSYLFLGEWRRADVSFTFVLYIRDVRCGGFGTC